MLWLRPCPRPQKTIPDRKNQASYAGNQKQQKNDYYRLYSQVLLHLKLGS